MSGMDLYVDGFPHGTREGFAKGCKGSACPAATDPGLSCRQADMRYRGDYAFQKMADRGMTPAEIVAADAADRAAMKPKKGKKPDVVEQVPVEVDDTADALPETIEPGTGFEVFEKPVLVRGRHGAASHYDKGCRHADCVAAYEAAGLAPGAVISAEVVDSKPEAAASVDVADLSQPAEDEVVDLRDFGYTEAEIAELIEPADDADLVVGLRQIAGERLALLDAMAGTLLNAQEDFRLAQAEVSKLLAENEAAGASLVAEIRHVGELAEQLSAVRSELAQSREYSAALVLELDVEKAKIRPAQDERSVSVTIVRGDGFEVHVDATGTPVFEVVMGAIGAYRENVAA